MVICILLLAQLLAGFAMTPQVTELENLITALKKALRAYNHKSGIPNGPVHGDLRIKAKEAGLSVQENSSLQELLEQTQARIQAEILKEFHRRSNDNTSPLNTNPQKKR